MSLKFGEALNIATSAPENLIFCDSSTLRKMINSGICSDEAKVACITELLTRYFLSGRSDETLDEIFKNSELQELIRLRDRNYICNLRSKDIPQSLWASKSDFEKSCELNFRKKLAELLDIVEGFIPVYQKDSKESEAFFIPFHFEENQKCNCICDLEGKSIKSWISPYKDLFGHKSKLCCIIHCKTRYINENLKGPSFMLPLFLAYKRKIGLLPKYDHLRLIASGEIRENRLVEVQVAEKYQAFKQLFKDAYFLFPETNNFYVNDIFAIALNTNVGMDEILEFIRCEIEAKGLAIPTFKDAIERIKSIELEIRRDYYNRWEQGLARVENMEIAIPKERNPESYLLCTMLKSACYCHMGRSNDAIKFNLEARKFAASRGFSKQFQQLEIEELVELQDEEKFQEVQSLAKNIVIDHNNFDLQMRYHGTMGQAHSYGYLSNIKGTSKEDAKWHFEEALKYAYKLDSEPDISQDLNYIYLWHVLFDNTSQEAENAYNNARNHIKCNLQHFDKSRKRNIYFLTRIRLMSYYRKMLCGIKIANLDYVREKLPDEADNWLKALACKYLAAIAAANGYIELSLKLFEDGIGLLPPQKSPNVIECIRLTLLIEFYNSLKNTKYLSETLRELKETSKIFPGFAKRWRGFLEKNLEYPALSYWY